MRVELAHELCHSLTAQTLLVTNRTILMGEQKGFEVDDLLAKLCALGCEGVVFRSKNLDFGL